MKKVPTKLVLRRELIRELATMDLGRVAAGVVVQSEKAADTCVASPIVVVQTIPGQ